MNAASLVDPTNVFDFHHICENLPAQNQKNQIITTIWCQVLHDHAELELKKIKLLPQKDKLGFQLMFLWAKQYSQ